MRPLVVAGVLTTLVGVTDSPTRAAEAITPQLRAVNELRAQDSAIALTIVAYQELQAFMIERDYDARLKAGLSSNAPISRTEVARLAALERDLRLQQLNTNVTNLRTTYDYARRHDETQAGVTVPYEIDTTNATKQLHEMVFIAPPAPGQAGPVVTQSIPVSTILRPKKPTAVDTYVELLQQCVPKSPALGDIVRSLLTASVPAQKILSEAAAPPVVVTYRQEADQVTGVVVQVFPARSEAGRGSVAESSRWKGMLDDDALAHVNELMSRAAGTPVSLGDPQEAARRLQLLRALRSGETPALAGENGLRVAILVPGAQQFLPTSLRADLRAVALVAELDSKRWQGAVQLVARDADCAERAARTVAAWQLLAESFLTLAGTDGNRTAMRDSLRSAVVRLDDQLVTISASLPAATAMKVSQRAATKLERLQTAAESAPVKPDPSRQLAKK